MEMGLRNGQLRLSPLFFLWIRRQHDSVEGQVGSNVFENKLCSFLVQLRQHGEWACYSNKSEYSTGEEFGFDCVWFEITDIYVTTYLANWPTVWLID